MRKIVQIALNTNAEFIYALCDDGTVWRADERKDGLWNCVSLTNPVFGIEKKMHEPGIEDLSLGTQGSFHGNKSPNGVVI